MSIDNFRFYIDKCWEDSTWITDILDPWKMRIPLNNQISRSFQRHCPSMAWSLQNRWELLWELSRLEWALGLHYMRILTSWLRENLLRSRNFLSTNTFFPKLTILPRNSRKGFWKLHHFIVKFSHNSLQLIWSQNPLSWVREKFKRLVTNQSNIARGHQCRQWNQPDTGQNSRLDGTSSVNCSMIPAGSTFHFRRCTSFWISCSDAIWIFHYHKSSQQKDLSGAFSMCCLFHWAIAMSISDSHQRLLMLENSADDFWPLIVCSSHLNYRECGPNVSDGSDAGFLTDSFAVKTMLLSLSSLKTQCQFALEILKAKI